MSTSASRVGSHGSKITFDNRVATPFGSDTGRDNSAALCPTSVRHPEPHSCIAANALESATEGRSPSVLHNGEPALFARKCQLEGMASKLPGVDLWQQRLPYPAA